MHFLQKLCLFFCFTFWFISFTGWFWIRVFKRLNKKYSLKIKFVKQDCWFGLFWNKKIKANIRLVCHCGDYCDQHTVGSGHNPVPMDEPTEVETTWYLCLFPCLPIIWKTKKLI